MSFRSSGIAAICAGALLIGAAPSSKTPTYTKDIAPILNARCVECHRAGEIGPMPLTNYKEVRPYAKAIREAVAERRMPPWHADPHVGKFANERRLSDDQLRTLLQWVNNGTPEGDAKDLPPAPEFFEGWHMGKPEAEFTMARPFEVPAEGVVEYQHLITPTGFTEDKWVSAAEIRPGNRSVLHHVIVYVLAPEGEPPSAQPRVRLGTPCAQARPDEAEQKRIQARQAELARSGRRPREQGVFLVGWAPGLQEVVAQPGSAWKVRAGSRLMFQLHYTPNGKAAVDSNTKVGLKFSKEPVTHTLSTFGISNVRIAIPPGDNNYEATSCFTFSRDVELLDFMPHMHLRGKDFTYRLTFPDGRSETALSVPRYDFGWQTWYKLAQPIGLPKDTRIDCTAHYDNSARNKYNPDPTKEVRWGDQTWEEMMIGWVTVKAEIQPVPEPARTTGGQ